MMAIKSDEDIRFLEELPISTRQSLFIDYLFKEFLYKFGDFFKLEHNGILLTKSDSKWREFIYKFLYTLEPRHFTPDTIVLDQFEEANEVVFFVRGSVLVGYHLFHETFWAKLLKNRFIIGAYACMTNKVSEFLYKPMDCVEGLATKKESFQRILRDKVGRNLQPKIYKLQQKLR